MQEEAGAETRERKYGVKLVRGPFVRLPAHDEACEDEEAFLSYAARLRAEGAHLAADLFSGAGGLSLGLEAAGYRVVLGADRDPEAVETHRHHFGGLALDWDLGEPSHVAKVAELVSDAGVELLAGGPPCQPFSRAGQEQDPASCPARPPGSLGRAQGPVARLPGGRHDAPGLRPC